MKFRKSHPHYPPPSTSSTSTSSSTSSRSSSTSSSTSTFSITTIKKKIFSFNVIFALVVLFIISILLLTVFFLLFNGYFGKESLQQQHFKNAKIVAFSILVALFFFALVQSILVTHYARNLHQREFQGALQDMDIKKNVRNWLKELSGSVKIYYNLLQFFLFLFLFICACFNRYTYYIRNFSSYFLEELGWYSFAFGIWGVFIYCMRKPWKEASWSGLLKTFGTIVVGIIAVVLLFEIGGFNILSLSASLPLSPSSLDGVSTTNNNNSIPFTSAPLVSSLLKSKLTFQIVAFILYVCVMGYLIVLYIFLSTSFMNAELETLLTTYGSSSFLHVLFPGVASFVTDPTRRRSYLPYLIVFAFLCFEAFIFGIINVFPNDITTRHHTEAYNIDKKQPSLLIFILFFMTLHFLLQFLGLYDHLGPNGTSSLSSKSQEKSDIADFHPWHLIRKNLQNLGFFQRGRRQ